MVPQIIAFCVKFRKTFMRYGIKVMNGKYVTQKLPWDTTIELGFS